jgi:hypothetical protein
MSTAKQKRARKGSSALSVRSRGLEVSAATELMMVAYHDLARAGAWYAECWARRQVLLDGRKGMDVGWPAGRPPYHTSRPRK